jgi:hypothetical protein
MSRILADRKGVGGDTLGYRHDGVPVPPVPEATTYIDVGALTIGIEYRFLTDEIVEAAREKEPRLAEGHPDAPLQDEGVSLHVCDNDRTEYIRFDNFGGDPHYHYIVPGAYNVMVPYDEAANGPFLDWALERLQASMPDMLREAGAGELADRVDGAGMGSTMAEVALLVKEARHRPVDSSRVE